MKNLKWIGAVLIALACVTGVADCDACRVASAADEVAR